MRLVKVIKCAMMLAVVSVLSLSGYIMLDYLPDLKTVSLLTQTRYLEVKAVHDTRHMEPRIDLNSSNWVNMDFRSRYEHLYDSLNQSLIGHDHVEMASHYFIYRCDTGKMGGCEDWADHIKGMEAAYLIANLTGRRFKAELYGFPCKLTDFVQPSLVNWTLQASFHPVLNTGKAGLAIRNFDDNHQFYSNLQTTKLTDIAQDSYAHVYFKTNLDLISAFQNSSLYSGELAWMKDVGRDDVHAALYKRLFKLSPRLRKRLDLFLYSILPSREHRLVCVDFDTFKNQPDVEDAAMVYMEHLWLIWNFIRFHSTTNVHKVFINTDSPEVIRRTKLEPFRDRMVSPPKAAFPNSGAGAGGEGEDGAAGARVLPDNVCGLLEDDVFTQHLLINCDVLVVSTHALGRMAAYVRGTDHGLYCLMGNGHIHPCRADMINELYNTHV